MVKVSVQEREGEVEYCEGSQLSVHKKENLPGTCNCASFSSALCDS